MGKHLAGLPSGRLHPTPLFCWLAIHWDCATDQQLSRLHDRLAESVRQTGMPSLQSCNAVEVDKTRASNHYSEFLYPFLYLKLFISTINAHFAASLFCANVPFCHEAPQFQNIMRYLSMLRWSWKGGDQGILAEITPPCVRSDHLATPHVIISRDWHNTGRDSDDSGMA